MLVRLCDAREGAYVLTVLLARLQDFFYLVVVFLGGFYEILNVKVGQLHTLVRYEYSRTGNDTDSYLAFVNAMREFKKDCGAEDCVALYSFFSDWYDTHEANRKAKLAQMTALFLLTPL